MAVCTGFEPVTFPLTTGRTLQTVLTDHMVEMAGFEPARVSHWFPKPDRYQATELHLVNLIWQPLTVLPRLQLVQSQMHYFYAKGLWRSYAGSNCVPRIQSPMHYQYAIGVQ